MTTPIKGTQSMAGTALASGQPVTLKWTQGSTEEEVYLDLGFVPSLALIHDTTTDLSYWWHPSMTAGSCVEFSDGKYDTTSVTAWHTSGQPKVVPTGKFMIRANTVITSTASDSDYMVGLKVDDGIGVNDAVMVLIAFP